MARKTTEDLNHAAQAATAAGMTYGQYQQAQFLRHHCIDRSTLREHQPVHLKMTDEYICPTCAHQVMPGKNCEKCKQVIFWRGGGK